MELGCRWCAPEKAFFIIRYREVGSVLTRGLTLLRLFRKDDDEMMKMTHGLKPEPKNDDGVPVEWIGYCKSGLKPHDIPDRPDIVYADQWRGWEEFLCGPAEED